MARQKPPIRKTIPKQLHVTHLPCPNGDELSLIIPNGSTLGPPTSRAVQVNLGNFLAGFFTRKFPRTELEPRLLLDVSRCVRVRLCTQRRRDTETVFENGSRRREEAVSGMCLA